MIKHFIAFMLLASPCLAGMGIGGFPYPGPGVAIISAPTGFCDGSDLFCTSWETGTDALNTGATGNEDVFNSSGGGFLRTTGGVDGTYRIRGEYGSTVTSTNGGSGFGQSVTVTGSFRFDDDNSGESEVLTLFDPAAWYELVSFQRGADNVTDDNLLPVNIKMKLTSSTTTELSMSVVRLNKGAWYHYSLLYNMTTNTARFIIYNSENSSVLDTGNQTLTIDTGVGIPQVQFRASAYGYISHDAIKVTP